MEYLELKLQNLMNLRNIYITISIALTGYLFTSYENIKPLILYCGGFIDLIFIINFFSCRVRRFDAPKIKLF